MTSKRTSLMDRTGDTWVQPDPAVDEWQTTDLGFTGWARSEIENVWGLLVEVTES